MNIQSAFRNILILFIGFLKYATAQDNYFNLKLNVKTVMNFYYNINTDKWCQSEYFRFDERGNKIEFVILGSTDTVSIYKYKYDVYNHLIEHYKVVSENQYDNHTICKYDSLKKELHCKQTDLKNKLLQTYNIRYDKNNNPIDEYYFDDSNKLTDVYKTFYNTKGDILKFERYDNGNNIIYFDSTIYSYSNNQIVNMMTISPYGKTINKYVNADLKSSITLDKNNTITKEVEFDNHGNPIIEKNLYPGMVSFEVTFFEYKYDEKGNWIYKTSTKNNIKNLYKRHITYY